MSSVSLSSTLTIANKAAANISFVQTGVSPDGSVRLDSSTTLANPRQMTIRHSSSKQNGTIVDRHLVQFSAQYNDASGSPLPPLVVNLTIANPRNSAITTTNQQDLIAFVKNFFTDANLASMLIGES